MAVKNIFVPLGRLPLLTVLMLVGSALLLTGCSSDGDKSSDGDADALDQVDVSEGDVPEDDQPDDIRFSCSNENPTACLYLTPNYSWETEEFNITYESDAGARPVLFLIYRPTDAPEPMPVVVLSHGGADGKTNPAKSMTGWAERLAQAGYLAVAVAHTPRDRDSREALCMAVGFSTPEECQTFKYLNWDRPHDVREVVDELEAMAGSPEWSGVYDLDRLGHMGHSAGAGCNLMLAGATRTYVDEPVAFPDERFVAFAAFSPQGPGSEGFTETSWDGLGSPVLVGTGEGDDTSSDSPEDRVIPHQLMPAGDKYQVFLTDERAPHAMYAGSPDSCVNNGTTLEDCQHLLDLLSSAVVPFFDAHLREDVDAAEYLTSEQLVTAGDGLVEWSVR